jgi:hypothetical protein
VRLVRFAEPDLRKSMYSVLSRVCAGPDIVIREEMASGSFAEKIAIEVKAG